MDFIEDSLGVIRLRRWQGLRWLVHGWTNRAAGDFRRLPARDELNSRLGVTGMELWMPRQVHSSRLHVAGQSVAPARGEADGMLSDQEGSLLGVRTADCLALLLVDRRRRAVAAVHAGWRGTVQAIAANAVERMRREFGSVPEEMEAALGPGIGPCCFEVGSEVAEQFDPGVVAGREKPRVDLGAANRRQLLGAGIPGERIWSSNLCTHCSPEQFFSHRRDGDSAGRMLAVIGVKAG